MVKTQARNIITTGTSQCARLLDNWAFPCQMFRTTTYPTKQFCSTFKLAMPRLIASKAEWFAFCIFRICFNHLAFIHLRFSCLLRHEDIWDMWLRNVSDMIDDSWHIFHYFRPLIVDDLFTPSQTVWYHLHNVICFSIHSVPQLISPFLSLQSFEIMPGDLRIT